MLGTESAGEWRPQLSQVALTLAHPVSPEQARRVGAEERQYKPGDVIIVPESTAMMVINAGYAQVDPADANAVRAALTVHPDTPPPASPTPGMQTAVTPTVPPQAKPTAGS